MTCCDLGVKDTKSVSLFIRFCFVQNTEPSPCSPYPEGDFRAAQVAQDEVQHMSSLSMHPLLISTFGMMHCYLTPGNSPLYAEARNEDKAKIPRARRAVVVARAQIDDQSSRQTGFKRQTGTRVVNHSNCYSLERLPLLF